MSTFTCWAGLWNIRVWGIRRLHAMHPSTCKQDVPKEYSNNPTFSFKTPCTGDLIALIHYIYRQNLMGYPHKTWQMSRLRSGHCLWSVVLNCFRKSKVFINWETLFLPSFSRILYIQQISVEEWPEERQCWYENYTDESWTLMS